MGETSPGDLLPTHTHVLGFPFSQRSLRTACCRVWWRARGGKHGPSLLPCLDTPPPLQEDVQQLQSMLGCELQAMLCVPVISRATDQVVALACAFNKLGGDL